MLIGTAVLLCCQGILPALLKPSRISSGGVGSCLSGGLLDWQCYCAFPWSFADVCCLCPLQELSDQQLKQMLLAYMVLIMKGRAMKQEDLDNACEVGRRASCQPSSSMLGGSYGCCSSWPDAPLWASQQLKRLSHAAQLPARPSRPTRAYS